MSGGAVGVRSSRRHDEIRLLYVLGPEFESHEADAMWEDARLGAKTFTSDERIAIVTDSKLVGRSVGAFGWLMPREVKIFAVADFDSASDWSEA